MGQVSHRTHPTHQGLQNRSVAPNRTMRGARIRDGRLHVEPIASFCASTWLALRRLNTSTDASTRVVRSRNCFAARTSRNSFTVSVRSTPRDWTHTVSEPCARPAKVTVRFSGSPSRAVYFPENRTSYGSWSLPATVTAHGMAVKIDDTARVNRKYGS